MGASWSFQQLFGVLLKGASPVLARQSAAPGGCNVGPGGRNSELLLLVGPAHLSLCFPTLQTKVTPLLTLAHNSLLNTSQMH